MFPTRLATLALTTAVLSGSLLAAPAAAAASGPVATGRLPQGKVFTSYGSTVRLLAPDGTTARKLVLPHHGLQPLVSPNGKWIAYETQTGLRMISSSGTRDQLLFAHSLVWPLAWSPDSHRLVTMEVDGHLRMINVQTRAMHAVLRAADILIRGAVWSPDGRHVLVASDSGWQLIRTATWSPRTFVKAPCSGSRSMSWSPDGRRIAMSCATATGGIAVDVLQLATGRHTVLADPLAGEPFWQGSSGVLAGHYEGSGYISAVESFDTTGRLLSRVPLANRTHSVQVLP
jgi:hypothetical protein